MTIKPVAGIESDYAQHCFGMRDGRTDSDVALLYYIFFTVLMKYSFSKIYSIKRLSQLDKIIRYADEYLDIDIIPLEENCPGGGPAEYTRPLKGQRAKIHIRNDDTGLSTIFILLHELGHHIDYLKRGLVQIEEDAYQYYPDKPGVKCPIKYRKHIRNVENQANRHAYEIATYLDLKIPSFYFIKNVIYQQLAVDQILSRGTNDRNTRIKLHRKAAKKAKEILKCQSKNPISLLFVTK